MTRRILITGSSRGLGLHLAQHYLAAGDVVIGCARGDSSLSHERYTHFGVDVSDESAVAGLFSSIRQQFGHIDVLINNAGIASMNAFALTPPSTIRRLLDINVLGPMLFTHGGLRLLRRSTSARVVNITSIAVPLRLEGEAVYAATKGALETFTRVMARELGPMGITCNAVGPSLIPTRLTQNVPAAKARQLMAQQAVSRAATPDDVAHVIDFLLRPESDLVTGQVIYLGGFG